MRGMRAEWFKRTSRGGHLRRAEGELGKVLFRLAHRAYRYNTHLAVPSDAISCNRLYVMSLHHEPMQTSATLRNNMQNYTTGHFR